MHNILNGQRETSKKNKKESNGKYGEDNLTDLGGG
jgi:hypothetical protein